MTADSKHVTAAAPLPEESDQWKQAYRDPQLIERRRKKHATKLARLGIFDWKRDVPTLDLCCGTGEVLRLLRDAKFSALHGTDVTIDEALRKETGIQTSVSDSRQLPYENESFEQVLCLHSLHHLGGVDGIAAALSEVHRILKPGGRLALVDHFDSPQLRLAFWLCRQAWFAWPTSGLRSFRSQLNEEWSYLSAYLDSWAEVRRTINAGERYKIEHDSNGLFFFYWVGIKK